MFARSAMNASATCAGSALVVRASLASLVSVAWSVSVAAWSVAALACAVLQKCGKRMPRQSVVKRAASVPRQLGKV